MDDISLESVRRACVRCERAFLNFRTEVATFEVNVRLAEPALSEEEQRQLVVEQFLEEELAAERAAEKQRTDEVEQLIADELHQLSVERPKRAKAPKIRRPPELQAPSMQLTEWTAGSPACAVRKLRGKKVMFHRMDDGEKSRETSLTRGYDALGAELHCMDTDDAPARGPSALELDLGLGELERPASRQRSIRSASVGSVKVSKTPPSFGRLPPLGSSKASGLPSLAKAKFGRGDPLGWSIANSHRMTGTAHRRHSSLGAVF